MTCRVLVGDATTVRVRYIGLVDARDSVYFTGRNDLHFIVILETPDLELREC